MKVAISTDGNDLESNIDPRFGRYKYFLIIDINEGQITKTQAFLNEGSKQGHGAGIRSAEQMGELGVDVVLTGDLGPNATAVLSNMKISVYSSSGSAKEAVKKFLKNELKIIYESAESHSGMLNLDEPSGERIFFPLLEDQGRDSEISLHFGHAPFFGIYDVEKDELTIVKNSLDHSDSNKSPIDQIEEAVHPTTIFAKEIGGRAIKLIQDKGLSLKTGDYNFVKDAIKNLDKMKTLKESCGH